MTQLPFSYPGLELEVFSHARRWKRYVREIVGPFLGKRVLEVGAGIGSTTAAVCDGAQETWLCLEPDKNLRAILVDKIERGELPGCCKASSSTVSELTADEHFTTVLYVDTLEHIEDDQLEVASAVHHLTPSGFLVVLAPAHQWLYSPFDAAIGHYRRYTRRTLLKLTTPSLRPVLVRYCDAAGLLTSLANRLLLRSTTPTHAQIQFWDRVFVPVSRVIDPLLLNNVGKSVVVVWQRTG
jgi:2-polyprenyl-3-methyl-5-hydroxy-6-metoxy-1,4-benzoquinol methylase